MVDRTTKVLLVIIAAAMWGLLLRPVFTPVAAQAAAGDAAQAVAPPAPILVVTERSVYLYHRDGSLYLFDAADLTLKARQVYVPGSIDQFATVTDPTFRGPK